MALSLEQLEVEKKRVFKLFFSNFSELKHDFLFKVGKYKKKNGWYLYAKDMYGYWRKILDTVSALALQELLFYIKREYKYKTPRFIIDSNFMPACFDELCDATWVGDDEMSKEYWKMREKKKT